MALFTYADPAALAQAVLTAMANAPPRPKTKTTVGIAVGDWQDLSTDGYAYQAWLAIATGLQEGFDWQQVDYDPSVVGLDEPITTIVKQMSTDPTAVPLALWIKVGVGATDWVRIGNGTSISLSTDDPLPDGIAADPGDVASGQATAKGHVHPLVSAETHGGKLWTAFVPDPLAHPPADAVFCEEEGCAPILFGTYWTEIATGVWQRNTAGMLSSGTTDSVPAWVGMRLMAWSGNISSTDRAHTGPYILTDTGMDPITHDPTYARMERAPDFSTSDQALSGAVVSISPPPPGTIGNIYGGLALQLQTPNPIELDVTSLDWELVTPPTPAPTKELLTATQLSLAGPDTNQATAFASVGTGEVELQVFTEHDTSLGGQTIPADGAIRFHVPAFLWADDPAADTVVHCYLRAHALGQDEAWVPVAVTQALHNTELGVWLATGTMGADYPIPIGSYLQARYTVTSTSTAGINLNFVYNDPTHRSYIEIPAIIGYAGTDDHNQLINRFWRGNPTPVLQHDAESMDPPIPGTVTTVAGFLTLPSKCTTVVQLMGTEPLLGISTREGNYSSIPLTLFIMQATTTDPKNSAREPFRVLTNEADMTGHVGFSAMNFGMMGMGPAAVDNEPPNYELTRYSCLQLICLGGTWWPVAPAFVYQSP